MAEETPAERRAREKKEKQDRINLVNEQERKRRQKAQEESAWEGVVNEMDNEDVADFFKSEFGIDVQELRYEFDEGLRLNPTDKEIKEASDILDQARKASKGGIFSSPNPKKAKRIIQNNKGKIKKARRKTKKKSCFIALVIMTGVGGGILYGLYEAGSAIISAMR